MPVAALIASACHLFFKTPIWIPVAGIIYFDGCLIILLICAAVQRLGPLPERLVALGMIPALFLVLVMSFADLYIKDNHIKRVLPDSSTETLEKPWDAAYFSLVTMTTVGYGDYSPHEQSGRKIVICELLSGFLLLLFAVPIVASRLATFDKDIVLTIQKSNDGSWTVQQNSGAVAKYAVSNSLKVTVQGVGKTEIVP